jgi:hypothetical protein
MLDTKQILQVFITAVCITTLLWLISQVAGFLIEHIAVIAAVAVAAAALGVWYLSHEEVKPKI